ncbi:MAG: ankyrin repeat domain-containing protein [Treponema sp.]
MKVAIFYDSVNESKANLVKDIINSYKCNVVLYDEASLLLQDDMLDPHKIMKDITHVLFIRESIAKKQLSFFVGYSIGAALNIILMVEDQKTQFSKQWSNLFTVLSFDAFDSYFKLEKKQFTENETKEKAKHKLLEKGYSLFTSNYVQAVVNNEVDIVKLFIKAGFSASDLDDLGTPVLSLAVRERHIEMVKALIKEGALLDAASKDRNYTALMDAAQIGEVEIAKILLEHKANPNIQSKDGQTALILAVGRQDVGIIEMLLKNHSDYQLKDSMGMSSLDYANLFRNEEILKLFEQATKS